MCGVLSFPAIVCFLAYGFYNFDDGLVYGVIFGLLLLPVLAFLAWFLYLRLQWCHWVKQQLLQSTKYGGPGPRV